MTHTRWRRTLIGLGGGMGAALGHAFAIACLWIGDAQVHLQVTRPLWVGSLGRSASAEYRHELPMSRLLYRWTTVGCLCVVSAALRYGTILSGAPAGNPTASIQQGIRLAAKGRCREALKSLKKNTLQIADKKLEYRGKRAAARCTMSLEDTRTAVEALLALKREFPEDPEVIYTATRFFSELASRSSEELAKADPSIPPA